MKVSNDLFRASLALAYTITLHFRMVKIETLNQNGRGLIDAHAHDNDEKDRGFPQCVPIVMISCVDSG